MRSFIAIELPEEAKDEIRRIQQELKKSNCLKASYTKEYHLTLKFLGEITPAASERAKEKLRNCTFRKFQIKKEKNFKPHITLARVKQTTNKIKLQQLLKSIKTEKKRFEVTWFKLKKSTLTKEGAKYEDLETY